MPRPLLKALPALLVPVALAWVADPLGVALSDRVRIVTVVVASALAAVTAMTCGRLDAPLLWLAGLVAWAVADAALRPVPIADAAWPVAAGVVALLLAFAARTPRGAAWARAAVVAGGSAAACWLLAERLVAGWRPGGPLENPDLSATPALLALALVPWLAVPAGMRVALGVLDAGGIAASSSRGALLAAVVLALVWGVAGRSRPLRRTAIVLAVLAGAGMTVRLALDRDPLRFERLRIWGVAVRTAVAQLPLGSGPGGFTEAALPHNFPREGEFARYYRLPTLAESDALQLAATLGIPGVGIGLGLAWSVLRAVRGGGPRGLGVAAALAVGSAFNTQLPVPAVAWTAALAVASVLPRPRGSRLQLSPALAMALGLAVAVPTATALAFPWGGFAPDPAGLSTRARLEMARSMGRDPEAADAEALAAQACRLAPISGAAWRTLGAVLLARAEARGDARLAQEAAGSFERARRLDPLDVWAALGAGQARHLLGDAAGALRALAGALALEPNCVPAWLEMASIRLEQGNLQAARAALAGGERALARARGAPFVTDYERALARPDRTQLARLRAALGEER